MKTDRIASEVNSSPSPQTSSRTEGIRQAAFFDRIPIEDDRYDNSKDIVNGQLVAAIVMKKGKEMGKEVKRWNTHWGCLRLCSL